MTDAQVSSVTKRTSGVAIVSLVMSCLSIFLGPVGFIAGIICGHIARSQCRKDTNLGGDGVAVAGLIIGYVFLVVAILALLLFLLVQPVQS